MQCEEAERQDSDVSPTEDPFVAEGLSSASSDSAGVAPLPAVERAGAHLRAGKAFREKLKAKLFASKARRTEAAASRRAERHGVFSSDSDVDNL